MKTWISSCLLSCTMILACIPVRAEVFVIVNDKNPETSLTQERISQLFTARIHTFPHGQTVHCVDHGDERVRSEFYKVLTGKTDIQMKAYWARLKFTGVAQAPDVLATDSDIIAMVRAENAGLAYVSAKPPLNSGVRVILALP